MAVRKETLMCYPQIYTQYHKEMKVPKLEIKHVYYYFTKEIV